VTAPPEAAGRPSGLGMVFPPARREAIGTAFIENLARIHRFADDPRSRALVSFARPRAQTTEAAKGVVAWWRRVWRDDALEDHPMVEVAFDWLEQHAPPSEAISLVHGDYRSGNFLFDPETNEVTAILDWELARFGDRHEDLGWILSSINAGRDDDGSRLVCGLAPRQTFLERYEKIVGLAIDPERIFYYELFSELKVVVIALGIGPKNAATRQAHAHLANLVFSPLGWRSLARIRDMLAPNLS
jgi:aminoglycoside phosphotransferase (APT) family kinase protein